MVSVAFSCEYYRLTCFSILFFHLQMLTLLCLHQLLVHVHVDECTCIWFLKITFHLTTAAHIMAQVILAAPSQVERYTSILELLINHGLDLNAIDRSPSTLLRLGTCTLLAEISIRCVFSQEVMNLLSKPNSTFKASRYMYYIITKL